MKKVLMTAVICGLGVNVVNGATVDQRLTTVENKVNWLDQDLMTVNNDSVIRDLNLQKQINELKQQGYDDSEIKGALYDNTVSIQNAHDRLQAHEDKYNELSDKVNGLMSDYNDFKTETKKGISQAIAISGLERPTYNDEKKLSIMIGTGSYKGTTSVAYGIAYTPNYDTVFSIKGSEDSVACSVGVNL